MQHIILLSGGSGKRLWPLSNDVYSKQFIRMPRGVRHGLLAWEEMSVIEVQTGEYFGADDRQIYPEDGASV